MRRGAERIALAASLPAWIAVVLLSTTGCRSAPYVWVQNLPREPEPTGARTLIDRGDTVEVRVYGDEQMTTKGQVLGDGTLVVPLLGPVVLAGKRPEEAARSLEGALRQYITDPKVTVMIEDSQVSVAVIGEVKQAGMYTLETPATVIQALAKAGGMTEFADESAIFVLRPKGDRVQRIRFTYQALVHAQPAAARFRLQTGDSVVVE